jgi:ABC-type branched-subunit amino acid transport system substrate-binding protein
MSESTPPPAPLSGVRPRLPRLGPFPVFIALAVAILIAGLVADTGTTRQTVAAGGGAATPVAGGETGGAAAAAGAGSGGGAEGVAGDGATGGGGAGTPTAGAGGSDSGAGAGGGTGAGGQPVTTGPVRGVTDDTIRIGVAIPDIGPFAVVDAFNLGDMRGHMEALLDGWRRDGLVPVHGRNIEFVFREFGIVGDADIAACNGFVKDDEVFAVIGLRSFENGAECLADRFDTPVITLDAHAEEDHARLAPYLFTLRASSEQVARNWIHWAHEEGLLAGRTIGMYEETDAEPTAVAIRETLESLGYAIAAHSTTDSKQGGPLDQVAVQRFRSAGVDLALMLVAALPQASFMEQAQAQGYRPTYIDTDYGDHTSDAASSIYSPAQYGGTFAVTMTRTGEIRGGMGLSPQGEACVANYERYSGRSIPRTSPESAELMTMLQGCDEGQVLLTGLQQAGRNLDLPALIAGLETIRGLPGASHGSYSFTPDRHHGADSQRTIQWLAECACWRATGTFGPLYPR